MDSDMKCDECDGVYEYCSGQLRIMDEHIGSLEVGPVAYYMCKKCKNRLLSVKAAEAIEKERSRKRDNLLQSKPLTDFVTATQAAQILGISRQAFHKHRRIQRGFIYQTRLSGKTVYLKISVLQFKKEEDGRFLLTASALEIPEYQPADSTSPPRPQSPHSVLSTVRDRAIWITGLTNGTREGEIAYV